MTDEELSQKQLEAPPRAFEINVDAQGRLQIPEDWQQFFVGKLDAREFFITLDKGWIKIFPKRLWEMQNATAFREKSEEEYEAWSITMQHYGWITGFDSKYRLTPHENLRTKLGLRGSVLTMMNHMGTLRGKLKADFEQIQPQAEEASQKQQSRPDGQRML